MPHEPEEPSGLASPRSASPRVAERLFDRRTVLLFGEVTSALAERVSAQLLALAATSDAPILMLIHSPGGHVESGDTIYDVVRFIAPEVRVLGSGWVASAGALIFAAAARHNRYALPNTRFLLHEPSGGFGGAAADIEIEARQVITMRARLNETFARATGQTADKIARDTARNHWMSADEARDYGLVGRVVERVEEIDGRGEPQFAGL